jgi:site-specific recombinase
MKVKVTMHILAVMEVLEMGLVNVGVAFGAPAERQLNSRLCCADVMQDSYRRCIVC